MGPALDLAQCKSMMGQLQHGACVLPTCQSPSLLGDKDIGEDVCCCLCLLFVCCGGKHSRVEGGWVGEGQRGQGGGMMGRGSQLGEDGKEEGES